MTPSKELLKVLNWTISEIKGRINEVESDESYTELEKSNLKIHLVGELNGVLRVANYTLELEEYDEFLNLNFPIIN